MLLKVRTIFQPITSRLQELIKKTKNRTPNFLKVFFGKFVLPYLSIILIALFVVVSNYVEASESSMEYVPSAEVMDLNPVEVAKTVNAINPYTPLIQGDAVEVVLALKDEEYLGKPVILETANTDVGSGNRKTIISYTVAAGDTISSIGWTYGLKISTIKSANNLTSDNIKLGQKLQLPPQDVSASTIASLQKSTTAAIRTAFKGIFNHPLRGWGCMSQVFGHTSYENFHTGIDLTSRCGTAILAAASGNITFTGGGWGGGYGNHIIISHGNGYSTLYGHLSKILVKNGQWVNQGQQIGIMGSTGWSTGVHLHFEIRKNNKPQNPLSYL